ncbi:MAG: sigma-70 family RNA polymerase sigma factor [Deltaproteobacteria bacterium]|nr:sigma-70 family RNA polymerase sigma factor [Deltaproteobacteria bacterium]
MNEATGNPKGEVTQLLGELRHGHDDALEHLISFVYTELRRVAAGLIRREKSGHTLRATEVVHEAYLRLFDRDTLVWDDRRHFFASAAIAMRRVLIDHARRVRAGKRIPKDEMIPIELAEADLAQSFDIELLALDQALNRLATVDARQAQIVELRYFAGLTGEEVAELLEISRGTVTREWRVSRLWLRREMRQLQA